jgi:hypothetical protein
MLLKVKVKNNYGTEHIYPVSEEAKLLAQLAGSKTLTQSTIEIAKKLGFKFSVERVEI